MIIALWECIADVYFLLSKILSLVQTVLTNHGPARKRKGCKRSNDLVIGEVSFMNQITFIGDHKSRADKNHVQ